MRAFTSDTFALPLPPGHRFPMAKYRRLRERVEAELPQVALVVAPAVADDDLALAHDPAYVRRVVEGALDPKEVRAIGFPWSPELVARERRSVGGTVAAAVAALEDGVAVNLAGGTHHAKADSGRGYCLFNDSAVAARVALRDGFARRVLVVDLDVHQGDGTAAICAGDPRIFTLSVHGERNFPFHKERSDLDVALPDGVTDDAYLEALAAALDQATRGFAPDLVLYVAGADPFEGDTLGRLKLTKAGLAARDEVVLATFADVPVAVSMAGGYAPDVEDIVDIHLRTVAVAAGRARR